MSTFSRIIVRNILLRKSRVPCISQRREYKRSFAPFLREMKTRNEVIQASEKLPNHRNTFLDWNYPSELYAFGKRLGEEFEDSLLRRALTEHSYMMKLKTDREKVGLEISDESEDTLDNLEFIPIGEEILDNIVVRYLRKMLPRLPEEGIQSIKQNLLSESTLSYVASHIGLTELILCQDYPVENATLVRVFKALISALNNSSGLDRTATFIRDFVVTQLAETNVNDFWTIENPVDLLFNICVNEGVAEPEPRLVGQCAVNTLLPLYRVAYYVDKKMIGLGPGESVQVAKEMAATDALWRLFGTAEHQLNIRFDTVLDLTVTALPNVATDEWCEKKVQQRLRANA